MTVEGCGDMGGHWRSVEIQGHEEQYGNVGGRVRRGDIGMWGDEGGYIGMGKTGGHGGHIGDMWGHWGHVDIQGT